MEKETKEQEQQAEGEPKDERPLNVCRNYIKLGDLEIGSDGYSIAEIINAVVWLLDNKSVKKYLDLVKQKKELNGGSSYLG